MTLPSKRLILYVKVILKVVVLTHTRQEHSPHTEMDSDDMLAINKEPQLPNSQRAHVTSVKRNLLKKEINE